MEASIRDPGLMCSFDASLSDRYRCLVWTVGTRREIGHFKRLIFEACKKHHHVIWKHEPYSEHIFYQYNCGDLLYNNNIILYLDIALFSYHKFIPLWNAIYMTDAIRYAI